MGRFRQNIMRRNGVYWFTKKLRTPTGWRRIEFSLNVRQPEVATMVAAQVSAQFHLLSHHVVSGQIDIKNFQQALSEVATEAAAFRRQSVFDKLFDPQQTPADATGADGLEVMLRAEVATGRLIELVGRHGDAMRDPTFFIETLDQNGYDEDEIRECIASFLPLVGEMLDPPKTAEMEEAIANGFQPMSPFARRSVLMTIGRTIAQAARTAAEQDLVGVDAVVTQAVSGIYTPPASASVSPAALIASGRSASPAPLPAKPAEARVISSVDEHPFFLAVEALIKRAQKGGGRRDTKDLHAIARLFAEFLMEQGVYDLAQLRQHHLAAFQLLFDELPTHWGKSGRDTCVADYRKRGAGLPKTKKGISAKTWNKHLSNIGQIITSIRATGGVVGATGEFLDPKALHIKIKDRGRDKRSAFETGELVSLFQLPVFTGCAGWERRDAFTPGHLVFHRALYFAPMLLYYTGARRDEICGLACEDVHLDDPIPYVHIQANEQRQIKNTQSERRIPIHSEVLRLGFADYVQAVRRLGYSLTFPDLYSATTASPLGDRLYDEIAGALAAAVPEDGQRKKVLHSLRHTVGSALKGDGVVSEMRADLLGHKGKTTTEETYVSNSSLKALRDLVHKLPVVTAHLETRPINLIPWVARKEPAPWGRAARARAQATSRS